MSHDVLKTTIDFQSSLLFHVANAGCFTSGPLFYLRQLSDKESIVHNSTIWLLCKKLTYFRV